MKHTRVRLALLAVIALIALPALLPATASAKNYKLGTGKVVVSLDPFVAVFIGAAGFVLTAGVAREWRRMDEGLPPTVP